MRNSSDRFQEFLKRTFLTNAHDMNDSEMVRKVLLMNGISLVGILFLVILGTVALYQRAYALGLADYAAALILIAILIVLRYTGRYVACCYTGVSITYLLYLYLFISGGVNSTACVWHYTFPLIALFLLGARGGTILTTALFIPSLAFLVWDLGSPNIQVYTKDFAIRFVPSFLTVFLFSYMYEKSRENAQRKLEQAYEEQEQVIADRTAQLEHEIKVREAYSERLRQSQKMEALGLMAGGVAHDLNNILSGMISYPELVLLQLPKDSKLRKPIERIKESGIRSAAVVDDLLAVARGVASPKAPANLNTIISEYLDSPEFKELEAKYPEVRFVSDLDTQLHNILCSPVHIRKCIMNLVANAAESLQTEGRVTVSTRNQHVDETFGRAHGIEYGQYAVATVEDTGSGINDDDRQRIFEPFYSRKIMGRSGTGLGLTVVWNTVRSHDGGIVVESDDTGTSFELYFPITFDEIAVGDEDIDDSAALMGDGQRILVVDDEPRQRDIACQILASLGYDAVSVSSGDEALAYLEKNSVGLVLLDMLLEPGMNGRETYENIVKSNPGQRALIVSGFAETNDVVAARRLGTCGFIKKPYTRAQLGKAVRECLYS